MKKINAFEELRKLEEGDIRFDDGHSLMEMALIGNTSDNIEIRIYGGEGYKAHFHFRHIQSKRKGCIRLDTPEYFKHDGNRDVLTSDEIDSLIVFLNSNNKELSENGVELSNYKYLCILWNQNNPSRKKDFDKITMPDYTKLK